MLHVWAYGQCVAPWQAGKHKHIPLYAEPLDFHRAPATDYVKFSEVEKQNAAVAEFSLDFNIGGGHLALKQDAWLKRNSSVFHQREAALLLPRHYAEQNWLHINQLNTVSVTGWETARPDANITYVNSPELCMHCALITQWSNPSGPFMSSEMHLWGPDRPFVAVSLHCLCLSTSWIPWDGHSRVLWVKIGQWEGSCHEHSWIMQGEEEATPPSVM